MPLSAQSVDRGTSVLGPAFAFMAAIAFALGTVLQQKGTLGTTSGSGDSHWLIQILHEPVWLAGLLLQAAGWVLQAVALAKGPLMVVQAITTLNLVIALPFGAWLTHQHIDRRVVLGALAAVVGIVVFLSVGSPHGGTTHPSARTWWITCLVTLVLVLATAELGRKRRGAARALLFGAAAGFGFALQTAVTKDFVTEIGGGVAALLADWSVYVLIASAAIGFILQQSALKTGVLAPAMASSNAVTLFAGVILGAVVYGETLSHGGGHVVPAIIGLALAVVGVVLLAGAEGPTAGETASGSRGVPAPAPGP
jgi:drug/metabolite transporter (DMT)-like permease